MSVLYITRATLLAGFVVTAVGCQARQLYREEVNFRQAMTDMYTEQAIDNLIRAREGLPFVQLSYSAALIQSTDMFGGSFSPSFTGSESATRGAAGAVVSTASSVGRTFGFGSSASRAKLVSFHADPVTNQNDVYEAYLAFAGDPNLLIASDHPPDCSVVCQKQCGQRYYYVPLEAGRAFQTLVLKTALMRGPETVPPGDYDVQVVRVTSEESPARPGTVIAQIYFNSPVPNGVGLMVLKLDGRTVKLPVTSMPQTEDGKPLDDGSPAQRLEAQWNPKTRGIGPDDLLNKHVHIYSYLYPPEAPTVSPFPQQVLNELDSIRANVSSPPSPH
jgi:hypothetical protein